MVDSVPPTRRRKGVNTGVIRSMYRSGEITPHQKAMEDTFRTLSIFLRPRDWERTLAPPTPNRLEIAVSSIKTGMATPMEAV